MTVTVVFGKSADGYLSSSSSNYTTARNGSGVVLTGGNALFVGQNFYTPNYQHHQGFIGFDYAAPAAGEVITSAMVRLQVASVLTPGISRDLEVRAYTWTTGAGFGSGDWRDSTQLAATALRAVAQGVNSATAGKYIYLGSDELLASMAGASTLEFVVVTNRQRAGTVPTADEALSFWSADASGTSQDPALIFTTVSRSTLFGLLGAQARLSDGTSVGLEGDGLATPSINLLWRNHLGNSSATLGPALTIGTGASAFAPPAGLQSFAVAAGPDDSVYVVGRAGNAENSIRIITWTHQPGGGPEDHEWDYGGMQTVALGSHDAAVNQVAACVVASNGLESLVVLAAHTSGTGWPNGHSNDVSYAILNTTALRTGTGTVVRGVGQAAGALFPPELGSNDWTGYVNQTGTGLDLVADNGNPGWLYASSFARYQLPGDNTDLFLTRGILSPDHTAMSFSSYETGLAYGMKDASAKLRVVPCGPGVAALVTADADPGYGITVDVRQHFGTDPGSVGLGYVYLASEEIPSMPDGPDIAGSHAWDAAYNATDNALWIYYVDTADATRLMRTRVSLSTYQATREEREVRVLDGPVTGVRLARNGPTGDRTRVYVAYTLGGALELGTFTDSFNVPPTAPTLATRDGFDATGPAVLSWTFNDPNVGDTQSAFRLQIDDQDTGTSIVDTAKTASAVSAYIVAGGTLVNGKTYRWRVRTWDAEDVQSPWSDYGVFQTAAGGSVTITLPAVDNPPGINTDELEIRWTVADTVQAAYRVWLYRVADPDVLVSDSGWVTSVATARVVSGMLSDREHRVEVRVRNAIGVVSNAGTRLITPSYGTPEIPILTVDPRPDQGYTLLQVRNPLPGEPGTNFPLWDFEVPDGPPAGWLVTMGAVERSAEQAHAGTGSAKLTADGGGNMLVRAPSVTITPGQRYTLRAWAFRPVAGSVSLGIDWLTPDESFISSSTFATAIPANTWTEIFVSGTAPDTAGRASYGPGLTGPPAAGTVAYVDDMILTVASDRPDVAFNYLLRRPAGTAEPLEVLGQCPPDGEFRDYTAASRTPYEYVARGVTA